MSEVCVDIERIVAGGLGLAREASGRVVLVEGALPGEQVRVELATEKSDFARGEVTEVLAASADRVSPPCRYVAAGCGGCDLQHAATAAQPGLKRSIVEDALVRLGRVPEPVILFGPDLPATDYRTTLRCVVVGDGRAALRRRGTHDALIIDECLVAHPLLDELLEAGRYDGAREVTLRVAPSTGDRLVVADPTASGVVVPEGVVVVGVDQLRKGAKASVTEVVRGRRYRVSARSFFQPGPEGAEVLATTVIDLAEGRLSAGDTLVDLYGGIGLFAGVLADDAVGKGRALGRIAVVERSRSSAADARHNLADLGAVVVPVAVERWRPEPAALVVADPSRAGLGRDGVDAVASTAASTLILLSCDPAALGRDTRLLAEVGLAHDRSIVVDQFAMTSHVEVVSRFTRAVV